jgi:hypothetical protein
MKPEDTISNLASHAQIPPKKIDYILAVLMPLERLELESFSSKCTCLEAITQTVPPKSL